MSIMYIMYMYMDRVKWVLKPDPTSNGAFGLLQLGPYATSCCNHMKVCGPKHASGALYGPYTILGREWDMVYGPCFRGHVVLKVLLRTSMGVLQQPSSTRANGKRLFLSVAPLGISDSSGLIEATLLVPGPSTFSEKLRNSRMQ